MVAAAVIGSSVVGGVLSSSAQSSAAKSASGAQTAASNASIAESSRQFAAIQALLKPYSQAATGAFNAQKYLADNPDVAANPYYKLHPEEHWQNFGMYEGRADPGFSVAGSLTAQQDLLGLRGDAAQQLAISGIANGAQMQALTQQGENAILQNASATGGLRGGNTQGALAQFRPQLLNQLIQQQYSNLGGLTSIGQNAAAGVGNAGQTSSNQIINALQQTGAAQAGNALAQGQAQANLYSGIAGSIGTAAGYGAF